LIIGARFKKGALTRSVAKTVSRGTVRKVRFENKAPATAPASNNRLAGFLRTFLIKADLFLDRVTPLPLSSDSLEDMTPWEYLTKHQRAQTLMVIPPFLAG
jgi:hypothetical protein